MINFRVIHSGVNSLFCQCLIVHCFITFRARMSDDGIIETVKLHLSSFLRVATSCDSQYNQTIHYSVIKYPLECRVAKGKLISLEVG